MILSSKGSGSSGPTYTGLVMMPKIISTQLTIPDFHVMPVRDIEIVGDGEIVIGEGSELLVL